jgi:sporulation protein YlmC with PRC-barrel domain
MEFREGVGVYTSDGEQIGDLERVVLDPRSGKVTHLVVRKGLIFAEDKVVPVDLVRKADEQRVELSKVQDELGELPNFEEVHYVEPDQRERERASYPQNQARPFFWYPPYGTAPIGYPGYPAHHYIPYGPSWDKVPQVERNIPEDSIPLEEGAPVYTADREHIGDIARLLIDNETQRVTHLVISRGLLLKSEKLIPEAWIRDVEEEKVVLGVGSNFVEGLPDYEEQ